MSENEIFFQIALQLVPGIGPKQSRSLIRHFNDAKLIFKAKASSLEKVSGIGKARAEAILNFRDFSRVEKELKFLQRYQITPLIHGKIAYPSRLIHCEDAPQLLYYKGNADLNINRTLAIIGTRSPTEYGKAFTKELIDQLQVYQPLIISGLAYGIDTIAHKSAVKSGMGTVGILAHGLDRIYPAENKNLAKAMLEKGGLLTEFMSGNLPDACNFPMRNRIIAGIADAVIVIETGNKGGSMITADIANSYNKDVFALPGRAIDEKSMGCNLLIRENKATLFTNAADIAALLNWDLQDEDRHRKKPAMLFPELSTDEQLVVDQIRNRGPVHIDALTALTKLKNSVIAAILLNLELQSVIRQLPGRYFALQD